MTGRAERPPLADAVKQVADSLEHLHECLTIEAMLLEQFTGSLLMQLRLHALALHPAIADAWPRVEAEFHDTARELTAGLATLIADVAQAAADLDLPVKLLARQQREGGGS